MSVTEVPEQRAHEPLKVHSKLKPECCSDSRGTGWDRVPSCCRCSALTQQLGDDVHGLAPQEQLPVAPAVTGEPPLAAGALLLQLHKVSGHVVVLGDHRAPWGVGQQAQPVSKYHFPLYLIGTP